jgi:phenylalanyl-tRNA synthetase alpha chain
MTRPESASAASSPVAESSGTGARSSLNADALRQNALAEIAEASSLDALESIRIRLLGKKGEFTSLMKELGSLPPEERKNAGAKLNAVKTEIESQIQSRSSALSQDVIAGKLEKEWIDVTLPVDAPLAVSAPGSLHPLSAVERELEKICRGLGFMTLDGPEIEREYYNFDALNMPESHPARDMQDTFWTKSGDVLRTQTSAMQVRAMERMSPPIRIVVPGRCFRFERSDATHEHTFYQMEGVMVDKHVSVGHLIYFMKTLLKEVLGSEQKIRLRPGYFPFVEPGFELDIWFQGRWLELLPCGLVHPKVLEFGGLNPNEWQGFAFGLGLSRLVMSRFQIDDIRHLCSGDLRFINQFS